MGVTMLLTLVAVLISSFTGVWNYVPYNRNPKNEERTSTIDLIEGDGFPAETHHVTTNDGYILGCHRIPSSVAGATPVLYLHGYEAASSDIVLRGRDTSLGYLMSDKGFDVWMINFRGNRYSRNHTSLDASKFYGEFWRFTWWEMGEHDLPAVIDYILVTTNTKQLQILGHGQGMTCLYVMFHTNPAFAEKISLVSAMSPIAYTGNTAGMLLLSSPLLYKLPEFMSETAFLTPSVELDNFVSKYCAEGTATQAVCYSILFTVTGFDEAQQNKSDLTKMLQHFPSGTSGRNIVHTAQNIKQDKFQAYDWGIRGNLVKYNSPTPPQVDLSRATSPHAIYLPHENDFVCQKGDYTRLIAELPHIIKTFTVDWKKWNHMDYLTAIDAPRLLYPSILGTMDKYKGSL